MVCYNTIIDFNSNYINRIVNEVNTVHTEYNVYKELFYIPQYVLERYLIHHNNDEKNYQVIIIKLILSSNLFCTGINKMIVSYLYDNSFIFNTHMRETFQYNLSSLRVDLQYMYYKKIRNYDFINPIFYTFQEIINIASYTLDIINYFKINNFKTCNIKSKGGYNKKKIQRYKPSLYNCISYEYKDKYYIPHISNDKKFWSFERKIIPLFKRSLLLKEIRKYKNIFCDNIINKILNFLDDDILNLIDDNNFLSIVDNIRFRIGGKKIGFLDFYPRDTAITCSWCDEYFRFCKCY